MAFMAPDTDVESGFKAPDEDLPKFKAPDDEVQPQSDSLKLDIAAGKAGVEANKLGYGENENVLRSIANSRYSGIDKDSPISAVMAPFTIAGNVGRAAISDAAATLTGHPSYGGNLSAMANEEPMPEDVLLSELSKQHPIAATAGKISQGTLQSAPMIAGMPEGAIGKLIAAGFSADMLANAGSAAKKLGEEMGKPADQRDADKITSAMSDIAQSTVFAPLAGGHALKGLTTIGETPAGKALDILGSQLKMPEGYNPPEQGPAPASHYPPSDLEEPAGPSHAEEIAPPDIEASLGRPTAPTLPVPPKMEEQLKAAEISVSPGMEQTILDKRIKSPVALQRVFPKLNVSLEEAQEILNQVWKTSENVPEKYAGQKQVESTLNESDLANIQRPSKVGVEEGKPLTGLDVPRLQAELDKAKQEATVAIKGNDPQAQKAAMGKMVYLAGAIEGAKKSGPNFSLVKQESEKPVLPETETTQNAISQNSTEVKQEAAPKQAGGGETGAISEPPKPTTPKTEEPVNPNTTGIAHRVSESEGMAAERGQGIGAEESVEKGRELLSKGADPNKVIEDFNNDPDKAVSANGIAIVRAHNEVLKKAWAEAADKFGDGSKEERAAWQAVKDWKAKVKPMQTEWHKQGMAQQGETEVDTGTFHGLREAYFDSTGKDFTPEQEKAAKATAEKVSKADKEADSAKKAVFDALAKEPQEAPKTRLSDKIVAELDKRAGEALKRIKGRSGRLSAGLDPTDLADHAIYGAAKIAKGVVKFADWSAEMVKDLGEYVKPHLKTIWDAARKELNASDQVKQVWDAAKGYLNKGESNFDDIVHKISVDLGMSPKEVREALAKPQSVRKMTDDMYRKMDLQRKMRNQAKDWLANAKYPKWMQYLRAIPKAFFSAKVFGHGTVGMITHAGNQMFSPLAAKAYWSNFFRQFKLMGVHDQGVYHEQMMQDLIRDPNFIMAKRAGLANDPFKYTDDFQNQFMVKFFHKIGLMGNRGFDALKLFRQEQFNRRWESLPDSLKTPEMAKLLADIGNHETGVVKARMGGEASSLIMFAPKLEGSRWMFLIGDPAKAARIFSNWKNESPEMRRYATREVAQKATIAATYMAALAVNQGLLSATGSPQKINFTNPRRSDWLSFKVAGHNLGIISPMLGAVRFMVNVIRDSTAKRSKFEQLQGSRAEAIAKDAGNYARTKLSPFSKTVSDVVSQSDFMGRPLPFSNDKTPKWLRQQGIGKYGYGEYITDAILPIPFEDGVRTYLKDRGMDDGQVKSFIDAITTAAVVGGTGARLAEDTHVGK